MTTSDLLLNTHLPTKPGERQNWGQLYGAANSLFLYAAGLQHPGLIVAITRDTASAAALHTELSFFAKGDPALQILNFPDWEILPYDHFSPHQDIISERLLTLSRLPSLSKAILIVPVNTLMHFTTTRSYVDSRTFVIKKGDTLDTKALRDRLETTGYRHVSQVMEHGEYSVRGSLLDIFPMGSEDPYRIDLFGDEIDSIRHFAVDTQLSMDKVDEIKILPATEFPLTPEAIALFRQNWRNTFHGNPTLSPIYESISKGQYATGIEYYLPLFFEEKTTLFDFFSEKTLITLVDDIESKAEQFIQEVKERYTQLSHDVQRPILEPKTLFLAVNDLFNQVNQFPQLRLQTPPLAERQGFNFPTEIPQTLGVQSKIANPLQALTDYLATTKNRILFCAETLGRREAVLELLSKADIKPVEIQDWESFLKTDVQMGITIAALENGLVLQKPNITLIAETQLFGHQVMQRRRRDRRQLDPENLIRDLTELKVGAPVVHLHHGVGKYIGLETISTGDYEAEYVTLEYSGGDKLYVPISALHLIARYTGRDDENAPLYQLGGSKWQKARQKASEKVRDVAVELLALYAKRQARQGFSFAKPNADYLTFSSEFPFEETPDQEKSINEVINDMVNERPMDRLVCGDVGFGKTEVAMRAAFLSVQNNKQVAILVPTTLLAQQHYQNFKDRFANWPISIAVISRFQSKKDQQAITLNITEGKVDIVIGTHKLLQSDIRFKDLGLLIIDEEHRFGVQQKEKIKSFKANVDILALTATPIPRTLNLSLTGVRDLSIIATPPAKRLAIKTFVREYDTSLVREAVLREILRGGQVYFLHNDVATMPKMCSTLTELIPEAKVNFAHGQMSERALENVMSDFYHARFNLLICSTIMESGIDIPTANTILINKANHFGLAQLHQLRGRVGRSHHQAYAYLLTPPPKTLTPDALKRLDAISSLEDLGAGFILATHDLEIRGAGEILGEDQSGFIEDVGFTMYSDMLSTTVKALQEGREPDLTNESHDGCEVDLKITALIPEKYVPDIQIRLTLYKRISSVSTEADLHEIGVEMVDRFGLLPTATKNLFTITTIKLHASPLGIKKIEFSKHSGKMTFHTHPRIELAALMTLIQNQSKTYKLQGSSTLLIQFSTESEDEKLSLLMNLIKQLTPSE